MENSVSRREVLVKTLPAVAAVGAGLGALNALAQDEGKKEADVEAARQRSQSVIERGVMEAHQNGQYALPKLPYDYAALEPHIDEQTMKLHHDKHHQSYVDGLNKALKSLTDLRKGGEVDMARLAGLERDVSFNAGGHLLHTIFWAMMAPQTGGQAMGGLAHAIDKDFGSFDGFKNYFSKVAAGVKGSGWAVLAYEPIGDMLAVVQVNEHDAHLIPGSHPLLPLDVWEHAYYLKYQNKRPDYIAAWWNVVNWKEVVAAYEWLRSRYRGGEGSSRKTG